MGLRFRIFYNPKNIEKVQHGSQMVTFLKMAAKQGYFINFFYQKLINIQFWFYVSMTMLQS